MTKITFLGGPETGNVAFIDWGRFRFTIGQPVDCDDPHIVAKARGNRFFRVGDAVVPDLSAEAAPPPEAEKPAPKPKPRGRRKKTAEPEPEPDRAPSDDDPLPEDEA